MLGARLEEAYPVVPLSEDHALSVGVFGYEEHAHFGFYADPGALPGRARAARRHRGGDQRAGRAAQAAALRRGGRTATSERAAGIGHAPALSADFRSTNSIQPSRSSCS